MSDRVDSGRRAAENIEEKLPAFLRISEHKKKKHRHSTFHDTLARRLQIKNELIAAVAEAVGTIMCALPRDGTLARTRSTKSDALRHRFLFFAFCIATQASNRKNQLQAAAPDAPLDLEGLLYSSLGFGESWVERLLVL